MTNVISRVGGDFWLWVAQKVAQLLYQEQGASYDTNGGDCSVSLRLNYHR